MTRSTTRSITALYEDFRKAQAAYRAIPAKDEKRWQRAVEQCSDLATQIVRAPASTVDEMETKIRIVGWSAGSLDKPIDELDNWTPDEREVSDELLAIVSLRADLRRLVAASAG